MEMWDASVEKRNQQEKEAKRVAKLKYKVISPMEQMLSGDDDNLFGFENTLPKRTRDVKKVRMKSLDLFPDDLL
jgi:hypothetical protein